MPIFKKNFDWDGATEVFVRVAMYREPGVDPRVTIDVRRNNKRKTFLDFDHLPLDEIPNKVEEAKGREPSNEILEDLMKELGYKEVTAEEANYEEPRPRPIGDAPRHFYSGS